MSFFQAFILALVAAVTSWWSPFCYGSLGDMVCGRPLVAGFVSGLVMGDLPTGIMIGAAIQAIYIGAVYVGGGVQPNIAFAQYIVIPLAIVSKASVETAIAMAIPLSMVGTLASLLVKNLNIIFVHYQDSLIDKGKLKEAAMVPVWGQITNFSSYFFPILLIDYFGTDMATAIINAIPPQVSGIFGIFGGMMPLLGFTILLTMIMKKKTDFIYYFFGFMLVSVLNLNMITIVVMACLIALVIYECSMKKEGE